MKAKSIILAIEIFLFFWVIIPLLLIGLNITFQLPVINNTFFKIIGILFQLIAILICTNSFFLFSKFGLGTPAPIEPPKKFVAKGLYKYLRNPMYVAYILSFLGIFLILGHLLLLFNFFASILLIHTYVLKLEEPSLEKRFGKTYKDYCQKVPRWGLKI